MFTDAESFNGVSLALLSPEEASNASSLGFATQRNGLFSAYVISYTNSDETSKINIYELVIPRIQSLDWFSNFRFPV